MSVPATPRRAAIDAIALAFAFLAVDAVVIVAVLSDWLEDSLGIVAVLALAAIVLLLFRDDVARAVAAGNERLTPTVDDETARRALDELASEGWSVEHDVANAYGKPIGSLVQGTSGAYLVHVRNRAYRIEHLAHARRNASWLHGEVGGWVSPVLCLALRDDAPHRRDGVWIMGAEHLADWLRRRTPPRGRVAAAQEA